MGGFLGPECGCYTYIGLTVFEFLVFEFSDSVTSMTQMKGIDKSFLLPFDVKIRRLRKKY